MNGFELDDDGGRALAAALHLLDDAVEGPDGVLGVAAHHRRALVQVAAVHELEGAGPGARLVQGVQIQTVGTIPVIDNTVTNQVPTTTMARSEDLEISNKTLKFSRTTA